MKSLRDISPVAWQAVWRLGTACLIALILGLITQTLRLSPIVGYLLAGVLVGPFTPGFVADAHIAEEFAELGVILLMFGVGLHFHLKDLLAVRGIAVPGAIGQCLVATLLAARGRSRAAADGNRRRSGPPC